MSEKEVIGKSKSPQTIETLIRDLKNIGIENGMVLLVHSSLSSIGWVSGGAVAIILALEEVLGRKGTLAMTAFSGDLSDPSKWVNPPVPENWFDTIKETMPAFDPDLTPTRGVGKIAEAFRKQKYVYRSNHPQVSFIARGRYAKYITGNHSLEKALGEGSPLAKIYKLGGYVLLIGVGYANSTSLHLAEYRADYPSKTEEVSGAPLMVSGKRKWVDLNDIKPFTEDFETLGSDFIKNKEVDIRTGYIGQAKSQLFRQKDLVDFAVNWIEENRK
jgi:aminoglycoside 3-N-acetyltransferase